MTSGIEERKGKVRCGMIQRMIEVLGEKLEPVALLRPAQT